MSEQRLYDVRAYHKSFEYGRVKFEFYVSDRYSSQSVDFYSRVIPDYNLLAREDQELAEGYIDELFTEEEVSQLRAYLLRRSDDPKLEGLQVEEQELPLEDYHCLPLGAIAVGGNDGMYFFSKEDGYDLPFEVRAYYNLAPIGKAAGLS